MAEDRTRGFRAVVLGSRRSRENDRFVYFLCENYGRLDAIVFGARKISGRWAGKFEPFNCLDILVTRKKPDLPWTIREVEPIGTRKPGFRAKEELVVQAAAEFLVHTSPGEKTGEESYSLVERFPAILANSPQPVTILLALVYNWSAHAGFGLPSDNLEGRLVHFITRAISDDPEVWRRYRLKSDQSATLLAHAKKHVEVCTDKRWLGVEMLM